MVIQKHFSLAEKDDFLMASPCAATCQFWLQVQVQLGSSEMETGLKTGFYILPSSLLKKTMLWVCAKHRNCGCHVSAHQHLHEDGLQQIKSIIPHQKTAFVSMTLPALSSHITVFSLWTAYTYKGKTFLWEHIWSSQYVNMFKSNVEVHVLHTCTLSSLVYLRYISDLFTIRNF